MIAHHELKKFVYQGDAESLYLALQERLPPFTRREQLALVAAAAARSLAMTRMLVQAGFAIQPIDELEPDPVEAASAVNQVNTARWLLATRISANLTGTQTVTEGSKEEW